MWTFNSVNDVDGDNRRQRCIGRWVITRLSYLLFDSSVSDKMADSILELATVGRKDRSTITTRFRPSETSSRSISTLRDVVPSSFRTTAFYTCFIPVETRPKVEKTISALSTGAQEVNSDGLQCRARNVDQCDIMMWKWHKSFISIILTLSKKY